MSGDALLATPARPLYEPSHRPPKKRSARSHSFCSDNTVTEDQPAAPVHSGKPFFGFRAYSRSEPLGLMLPRRSSITYISLTTSCCTALSFRRWLFG